MKLRTNFSKSKIQYLFFVIYISNHYKIQKKISFHDTKHLSSKSSSTNAELQRILSKQYPNANEQSKLHESNDTTTKSK